MIGHHCAGIKRDGPLGQSGRIDSEAEVFFVNKQDLLIRPWRTKMPERSFGKEEVFTEILLPGESGTGIFFEAFHGSETKHSRPFDSNDKRLSDELCVKGAKSHTGGEKREVAVCKIACFAHHFLLSLCNKVY